MIRLQFSLAILFLITTFQSFSQVDFGIRKQKLLPTFFDTAKENTFIYDVPNVILYFKQSSIKDFIENTENKNVLVNYAYKTLHDTIAKNIGQIKITDIYFSLDQHQRDSIFRQQPENILTRHLNEQFYSIGAALILKGQFMIYSKADKSFLTKKLVAKKEKGYFGQESLNFYLPGKKQFYYIITALGE